jgi:hypothetical protein
VDTFMFRVTDAFGNTDDGTATVVARPRLTLEKQGDGSVTSEPTGISCDASCTTDIAHFDIGSSVTLTAEAQPGKRVPRLERRCLRRQQRPHVRRHDERPRQITATFDTGTYTLDVSRSGTGTGNVTSSPGGIDLSAGDDSAPSRTAPRSRSPPLPRASTCSSSGAPAPAPEAAAATCTFTITDDTTVDARFVPAQAPARRYRWQRAWQTWRATRTSSISTGSHTSSDRVRPGSSRYAHGGRCAREARWTRGAVAHATHMDDVPARRTLARPTQEEPRCTSEL